MKFFLQLAFLFFLVSLNNNALSESSDNVTTYPGDLKLAP